MTTLRSDTISGLTGPTNYQGSIYASGAGAYLLTKTTAPGTDDFTIEFWINSNDASGGSQEGVFGINAQAGGFQGGTGNQIRLSQGRYGGGGTNGGLEVDINGTSVGTGNGNDIIQEGTWYHVAVTRASGTVKIWVDGVEKASGSAAGNVTGTTFVTGYYDSNYTFQGYMSNFRYRKGTAYYTTTFTPPTGPLERTSDTELIFAQSVNNASNGYSSAIHGGTTDIMQVFGNVTANTSAPTLTTSSSVGVVFDGDPKFNTQGVMYFPTGDTAQRGRGRGVFGGGEVPGSHNETIDYIQIHSLGNALDFGSLATSGRNMSAPSSATRGLFAGAYGNPSHGNTVEYITIATTSNGTDFGDLTVARSRQSDASNSTRGIVAGGNPYSDVIDYATIATTGNFTDFGNLTAARFGVGGMSSPTKGVFACGQTPASGPQGINTIDQITIATTGNASDFGDSTSTRREVSATSSHVRGLFGLGYTTPSSPWGFTQTVDYITLATSGNGIDFGDLVYNDGKEALGATSNSIRGVFGPSIGPNWRNTIEYVTIATLGNSKDFGDLFHIRGALAACSDSHGGLS